MSPIHRSRPRVPSRAIVLAFAGALLVAVPARAQTPGDERAGEEPTPTLETGPLLDTGAVLETIAERLPVAGGGEGLALEGDALILGASRIPLRDAVFLRLPQRDVLPGSLQVVLADGDRLWVEAAAVAGGDGDAFAARIPDLDATVSVPLTSLRLVLVRRSFRGPRELDIHREKRLGGAPESDSLALASGSSMAGILESIGPQGVRFSTDDVDGVELSFEKLLSVRLAALEGLDSDADADAGSDGDGDGGEAGAEGSRDAPSASDGREVAVTLQSGSRLSGRLSALSAGRIRWTHAVLGELSSSLDAVSRIDFVGGRCRYLSDLEPVEVREHLGLLFRTRLPWRRDQSVLGGPIRLAGRRYERGLGVHAYSRLEYDLAGRFGRFRATVGLDDSARPLGGRARGPLPAVVFRVWVDGRKASETRCVWGEAPRALEVPVRGAKRLALEVDFGHDDLHHDRNRANWAEARVLE